jgi:hypothetical protein
MSILVATDVTFSGLLNSSFGTKTISFFTV